MESLRHRLRIRSALCCSTFTIPRKFSLARRSRSSNRKLLTSAKDSTATSCSPVASSPTVTVYASTTEPRTQSSLSLISRWKRYCPDWWIRDLRAGDQLLAATKRDVHVARVRHRRDSRRDGAHRSSRLRRRAG